jgi:hypothetical protein
VKKTLNITSKSVLEHLGKQHSQSAYITDLVLKDMSTQKQPVTREEIIKLIQEYSSIGKKINTTKDDCVLDSVKNLIKL